MARLVEVEVLVTDLQLTLPTPCLLLLHVFLELFCQELFPLLVFGH